MNRRSFFSSLAAFTGAASLSPHIFIPKFEPVKWKAASKFIKNPGWFVAEYECYFIDCPAVFDTMIFHKRETQLIVPNRESVITVERGSKDVGTWSWKTP